MSPGWALWNWKRVRNQKRIQDLSRRGEKRSRHLLGYLRIEQLGEAGVVEHGLEVVVGAGLEAVSGVHLDGAGEIVEAALGAAGDGVEEGEAVVGVIGVRVRLEDAAELLGGLLKVAGVELRDGVIEALLGGEEAEAVALQLAAAGVDVHAAALDDFRRSGGDELLKGGESLFIFALLHEGDGCLVMLEGGSGGRSGMAAAFGSQSG